MHFEPMFKRALIPALLGIILATLIANLFINPHTRPLFSPDYWRELHRIGAVMRLVKVAHVDGAEIDYDTLGQLAIERMLTGLDPYSSFFNAEAFTRLSQDNEQRYVGIGVQISKLDERVTITRVFPGSGAEESGILAGDQIIAVAEKDTRNASVEEVVSLLRGDPATETTLTLQRPRRVEPYTTTVERRYVTIPSIEDVELDDEGIAYLRLVRFGAQTASEMEQALAALPAEAIRGLIIDLRDNPGGLLDASLRVAELFIPTGQEIIRMQGRDPRDNRRFLSQSGQYAGQFPVVILVNQGSASASEVVAGALRDQIGAVLVGQTTVGKGSVQSLYHLGEGQGMKLTTARYILPRGDALNGEGLEPAVEVIIEPEDYRTLLRYRHRRPTNEEDDEGIEKLPPEDRQRQAAETWLRNNR